MVDEWEQVNNNNNEKSEIWDYRAGKEKEIIGVYQGKKERLGEDKDKTIHLFRDEKGALRGVWETNNLKNNLIPEYIGKKIKLVYNGKVKIGGGKTVHSFDVFVSKNPSVGVSPVSNVDTDDIPF